MDIFYGNMAHAHVLVSRPPREPGDKAIKLYNANIHAPFLIMCTCMHQPIIALHLSADLGVCCNQPDSGLCSTLLLGSEKADGHC